MDRVMVPLRAWVWLTASWQSCSLTQGFRGEAAWVGLWMLGQQVSHKYYKRHQTPREATSLKVTRSRQKAREG